MGEAMKQTPAQVLLAIHLLELGIATTAEYRFSKDRRWRLDLYSEHYRLGFEVNGTWKGLHGPRWSTSDLEKVNTAQMMGIRVLTFTNEQVERGEAKKFIESWVSKP